MFLVKLFILSRFHLYYLFLFFRAELRLHQEKAPLSL